jgi:cytochrome b
MHTAPDLNPSSHPEAASPMPVPTRLVVDAPTRMFHWLFALSFVGAYLTADGERWRLLHVTLGYTLAGLLAFRVLYGLFGPRQAGVGQLWRKLASAPDWLRSLEPLKGAGTINWRQGQNLLMALAVFALLVMAVPLTLSGYGSYSEWGDWLEDVHEFLGEAFLAVVLGHVALIAALSVLRRKNQALPMLTGCIEGPGPALVKNKRTGLAVALLAAVVAFGIWQWQQSPDGLVSAQAWNGTLSGHSGDDDDD